ncbi:MAG TPA: hypothetical protein VGF82_08985 [Terracidiphilus sp.]|jgi:hypothetical protein
MRKTMAVWFYIGVLLAFYGLLLGAAGVYQWTHPPATVLANRHATFWVGVVLLLVGATYIGAYWPRRDRAL